MPFVPGPAEGDRPAGELELSAARNLSPESCLSCPGPAHLGVRCQTTASSVVRVPQAVGVNRRGRLQKAPAHRGKSCQLLLRRQATLEELLNRACRGDAAAFAGVRITPIRCHNISPHAELADLRRGCEVPDSHGRSLVDRDWPDRHLLFAGSIAGVLRHNDENRCLLACATVLSSSLSFERTVMAHSSGISPLSCCDNHRRAIPDRQLAPTHCAAVVSETPRAPSPVASKQPYSGTASGTG